VQCRVVNCARVGRFISLYVCTCVCVRMSERRGSVHVCVTQGERESVCVCMYTPSE
jgi:hypothetical protein